MWRTYTFADDDEAGAGLIQTVDSIARGDAEHAAAAKLAQQGAQVVVT